MMEADARAVELTGRARSPPVSSRIVQRLPAKVQHLFTLRPTLFLRSLTLFALEASVNLLLWVVTLIVAAPSSSSNFASLALIAWTTGLRHGLDADHICAIDNATRRIVGIRRAGRDQRRRNWKGKLFFWRRGSNDAANERIEDTTAQPVQQETIQRPLLVGLWFSLGHSTVVIVVTVAISISLAVATQLDGFGGVGSVIGPAVSGSFLFLVALGNSIMLARAWRARKRAQREEKARLQALPSSDVERASADDDQAKHEQGRFMGMLTRLTMPLINAVSRPHHMYVVGALFGLGFDTASTIALLSVSASAGLTQGGNAKVVLLAFLFTAGMTWVDSCDSILMVWAYAPPDEDQAGGGGSGSKRWWALFEEKKASCSACEHEQQLGDMNQDELKGLVPSKSGLPVPPPSQIEAAQDVAPSLSKEYDCTDAQEQLREDSTAVPAIPLRTLSDSAQALSHLLTLLSIILAFAISIIVLMGLIASECPACARSLELHQEPLTEEVSPGSGQERIVNDGGLAGRWWAFWDGANEQSGFIGAGIVACFVVVVAGWRLSAIVRQKKKRRSSSRTEETVEEQQSLPHE
ncbi:hypothetical protein BCV69DRAFT_281815 [Microstroma glucosiphilum]|uniref:Nickel/cobalt efflux system n=1 Tax=Pseudomicrostroma glucosiphilum TaxID=1684307 RepID=A0A316UAM8_9BASI|nr:hypothetical protein BCV69DRAFT_281815 [Pseudomicrostroma glucosiphilum]PWN21908.1 hypothetical protein BCV69DRAFT_281815 [Pseudomicrostroma glucosiphilum]